MLARKLHGYSAHGWHEFSNGLCVYHQGGLDTYCGFYAILNLVSFLKFQECRSSIDFIGADDFREFKRFIEVGSLDELFPQRPFGNDGLEPPMVADALSRALAHFGVGGKVIVEDDHSIAVDDTSKWDRWFRYGAEKPFVPPETADGALGLAAVMEDECDKLGHWAVFVGQRHLEGLQDTGVPASDNGTGLSST